MNTVLSEVAGSSASKLSFRLASCGLACLVASLLLPAFDYTALDGTPAVFNGGQAALWAFGLGIAGFQQAFVGPTHEDVRFAVLGIAAVLNFVFLATPAVLRKGTPRRATLRWLGGASVCGLILGIAAPMMVSRTISSGLIGYFVWLLGHALILGAIVLAWKALATQQR